MRPAIRLITLIVAAGTSHAGFGAQMVVPSPPGGQKFGTNVTLLPNGHFIVTDPGFDVPAGPQDVGAVHHYAPNGVLVATLKGSSAGDQVGSAGVVVLATGDYLVRSPAWRQGGIANAGAITRVDGDSGLSGVVSAANSLVGSSTNDRVGQTAPIALSNGAYVVVVADWDNGGVVDAGAVVHGPFVAGIVGPISAANALVGASAGDRIGSGGIVVLSSPTKSWLASSPDFDHGAAVDAGAVTMGTAASGRTGVVSAANSLVGSSNGDRVGAVAPVALVNGNFVVVAPDWNNGGVADAGAAAFGSGALGLSGTLGASNALVGSNTGDRVGSAGVTPLPSGGYLVRSPQWRNGSATAAGAVSFGSGSSGVVGTLGASNSLVGASQDDRVGETVPLILANGNYVVGTPTWNNGASTDAGAITFGFGNSGRIGTVATNNSLTGSSVGDRVGERLLALTGGNAATLGTYVVVSPRWSGNGGFNVGAVTTIAGTGGISGAVAVQNSLVGAQSEDRVGDGGAFALADGRFVVASPFWNNGALLDAGAVTLREPTPLASGIVSSANSLIGANADDRIGGGGVVPLSNAAYIVLSPNFSPGAATRAGAVTWVPATTGLIATVSAANSLVGSQLLDDVGGGSNPVTVLDDGDAVLVSPFWDDGSVDDVGAATYIDRDSGRSGAISPLNSLVGSAVSDAVGLGGVIALPGGDYLVRSSGWRNGAATNAGAVTYGNDSGSSGVVSPANSIVGSTANDFVGSEITAAANGTYLVRSSDWDNGAVVDAGAFTLGLPNGVVAGALGSQDSVLGPVTSNGQDVVAYDPLRNQMIVGQPLANRVVIHRSGLSTSCSIVPSTPNPSDLGASVTFGTSVSASGGATPEAGRMTVVASNGQQCVDSIGASSFPGIRSFSCNIAFSQEGNIAVYAEYTGSTGFTFCRTPTLTQTVVSRIFSNGFE